MQQFLQSFIAFHANGFYSITYLLYQNIWFIFVLAAITYLITEELKIKNFQYINDERRMT